MNNTEIVVAVPVLARPHRVQPLLSSLDAARRQRSYRTVFVVSPNDQGEIDALRLAGADFIAATWPPGHADFALKQNLAFRETTEPWFFAAADDLVFHEGWADEALHVAEQTGKRVIGTNDLANPRVTKGEHATHALFHRDYVRQLGVIDAPGKVYSETYSHQFVDDEAVQTAKVRGEYAFAVRSRVEHTHPCWGTAENDWVYEKGQARFTADRALYQRRQSMWLTGTVA